MARNCVNELLKLFNDGREGHEKLSKSMLEDMVNKMSAERQRAFLDGIENPDSQYREKAMLMIERVKRDLNVERAKAVENLHKRTVQEARIGRYGTVDEGLSASIVGTNKLVEDGRFSVDATQKGLRGRLLSVLMHDLVEDKALLNIARDGGLDREIRIGIQELNKGAEGNIDGAGISNEAKRLAAIFQKSQKAFLGTMNSAGAYIRELSGYAGRITHDADKIVAFGKEKWIDAILPLLDHERTFRSDLVEQNPREFLGRVWDDIRAGKSSRAKNAETRDRVIKIIDIPANLSNRAERSRTLHFQDASAEHSYLQQFGESRWRLSMNNRGVPEWTNSPITLLEEHVRLMERGARDAGLMQHFGTNPEATFQRLLKDLNLEDPKYKYLKDQMAEVLGTTMRPGDSVMAKVGSTVRGFMSMAKLGSAFLKSFPDIEARAAQLKSSTGESWLSAHGKAYQGFIESLVDKKLRQEASHLTGVAMEAYIGATFSHLAAIDSVPGGMAKALHLYHKLSILGPWTDINKQAHALVLSAGLGMRSNMEHAALDGATKINLSRFGIGEHEWEVIRQAAGEGRDGRLHIGHEGITEIPNEKLQKIAIDAGVVGPETRNPDRALSDWKHEIAMKLSTYYSDQVNTAMLEPGARERAFWLRGTHADTIEGQVLRFIAQFKSYPTAMITKAVENVAFANGAHSWSQAIAGGNANKLGLVSLAGTLTAMAYISNVANSIAKGQAPPDPSSSETWKEAFKTGGVIGLLGDAVLGEYDSRYGRGFASNMLGPVAGQADDLADMYSKTVGYMTGREKKPPKANLVRMVINNTPGNNLFYMRGALNYLFLYNLQESLNPGFQSRMEARMKKKGQPLLVQPIGH